MLSSIQSYSPYAYITWNIPQQHLSKMHLNFKSYKKPIINHLQQKNIALAQWLHQNCHHHSQQIPIIHEQKNVVSFSTAAPAHNPPPLSKTKEKPPQNSNFSFSVIDLEQKFSAYHTMPEWKPHKDILKLRDNALGQIKNDNEKALQQTIYNEFILINEKIAYSQHNVSIFKKNTKTITDLSDAGSLFNQLGNINKAIALADACWMLLDCIQAFGEGIIKGAHNSINSLLDPKETMKNIMQSAETCGYYVGKAIFEIGKLGYLSFTDTHKAQTKLNNWLYNFEIIYTALHDKRKSLKLRDIIKETTAFGIECYATAKALQGFQKIFSQAHKHIKILTQKTNSLTISRTNVLATPEGITIRMADNAVEYIKANQQTSKTIPSNNKATKLLPNFIQQNRIPIDKETILHHPSFQKTKLPPVKGAQVYKKINAFIIEILFIKEKVLI